MEITQRTPPDPMAPVVPETGGGARRQTGKYILHSPFCIQHLLTNNAFLAAEARETRRRQ